MLIKQGDPVTTGMGRGEGPLTRTRFRCIVCGKLTAGRLPRNPSNHREVGDGTFWFPRRHKINGQSCLGNIEEAELV